MEKSSRTTLAAFIAALAQAVAALFAYLLEVRTQKNDKVKQFKIDSAEDRVDDACSNGTISDLLDASKELGDAKRGNK